jgi:mRNA interferase RelE/StbE
VSYEIFVERAARKALARLSADAYERVGNAIEALADDPRSPDSIRLSGRPGYRLRIGDYRILYAVDDEERVVAVFRVGYRRVVYR